MLSQTVEYALRAATFLASAENCSGTVEAMAGVTHVPAAYLSKVLQQLVRGKIVESRRGAGGGFRLSRPPEEIRILDIVEAVEPIQRIHTCPLGLAAHGKRLCPLHRRLDNALATLEKAFAASTLAEIIAEPSESIPLRERPPRAASGSR